MSEKENKEYVCCGCTVSCIMSPNGAEDYPPQFCPYDGTTNAQWLDVAEAQKALDRISKEGL